MKRLFFFCLAAMLAGCGGGGGGGGATPAAATAPSTGSAPSASVQRSLLQQSLTSTNQSSLIAQYGTSSTTLEHVRRAMAGERFAAATCANGEVFTTTPGSAPNVANVTLYSYYDTSCRTLWFAMQGTITSTSATSGTANVAYTYYTPGGSVYRYAGPVTLTLSGIGTGSATFTLQAAIATAQGAAPFTNLGLGCSIAPTSDGCSIAEANHLAGLSIDEAAAISVSASFSSGSGNLVMTIGGNGAAYTGSLDATSVVSTGGYAFGIAGGSQLDADSLNGSLTFSPSGVIAGGSLALSDAADGATVTAAYNASSQTISGTVSQSATGTVLASYSVSLTGSGTVSYSNGTTGTIANWVVQS